MQLTPTQTVYRKTEIIFSEMNNEVVIMNMTADEYLSLDEIGSHIWLLIEKPITIAQLCEQLAQSYQVSPDECQGDTIAFLADLHQRGLIVVE